MAYNGEGIRHIALETDDLISSLDKLKVRGLKFMKPLPGTYNKMLEERLPGHSESLNELQPRGILLDGATGNGPPRLLLQIFSGTRLDPSFFEFIQRKKYEDFGEGNFKALFESIERDQLNAV
jgi:4-hydroxyphenylpyruvate dioxygenase